MKLYVVEVDAKEFLVWLIRVSSLRSKNVAVQRLRHPGERNLC